MVELSLGRGERMVISSHAQLGESSSFGQLKTGDAFLTNNRFVFMGRVQVKSWGHLAVVAAGRGKTHFEIPASTVITVRKRRLGIPIEIIYREGSKEKKALFKPEKIRYLGAILGLGISAVGREIGQKMGDSFLDRAGEMVGEKIGEKAGELVGQEMERIHTKGLVDAWMEAFEYVTQLQGASSETLERAVSSEKGTYRKDSSAWEESVYRRSDIERPQRIEKTGYSVSAARKENITKVRRCEECPYYQPKNQKYGFCTMKKGSITGKHVACDLMRE
jgi:hypothetical protein